MLINAIDLSDQPCLRCQATPVNGNPISGIPGRPVPLKLSFEMVEVSVVDTIAEIDRGAKRDEQLRRRVKVVCANCGPLHSEKLRFSFDAVADLEILYGAAAGDEAKAALVDELWRHDFAARGVEPPLAFQLPGR